MTDRAPIQSVLFICTGNIFRSMVAEFALRARLGPQTLITVRSAGIQAVTQPVHPVIRQRLSERGVDVSLHVQQKLTRGLLDGVDLAVAMGLDHQAFVRREFGREVPLFNEFCFRTSKPILDVHEAVPDWSSNMAAAHAYAASVIEQIWEAMPAFLARLSEPAR